MAEFFQQTFSLLIDPPGNLTYYLVLAFSIVAALPGAIQVAQTELRTAGRRMITGLSLLLVGRFCLFLGAALTWQGLLGEQDFLPVLDRLVTLLDLVIVIWLWIAPERLRMIDATTGFGAILVFIAGVFSILWWSNQSPEMLYNGSLPDQICESLGIILCLGGIVALVIRRPPGWGIGITMLTVLTGGHIAHLVLALPRNGDYPGAVRLAQMIAYPFLLGLQTRFPVRVTVTGATIPSSSSKTSFLPGSTHPEFTRSLLNLSAEANPYYIYQEICRLVAQEMRAEVCLISLVPDSSSGVTILCGYNQAHSRPLDGFTLQPQIASILLPGFMSGEPLLLAPPDSETKLAGIRRACSVDQMGETLIFPLENKGRKPIAGLFLFSPYNLRHWDEPDLEKLAQLNQLIALILQQTFTIESLMNKLILSQEELAQVQADFQSGHQGNQYLQVEGGDQTPTPETAQSNHIPSTSYPALLTIQDEAQRVISNLRMENARLGEQLSVLENQFNALILPNISDRKPDDMDLGAELRLALEEVARLNALLSEQAYQRPLNHEPPGASSLSRHETERLAALMRELQQPAASILNYSEILLCETTGRLSAEQQSSLESVRVSSQSIIRIIKKLNQAIQACLPQYSTGFTSQIDFCAMVDQAINEISGKLQSKNLALEVVYGSDIPQMHGYKSAWYAVITDILSNTAELTQPQGKISVQVESSPKSDRECFILMKVSYQSDSSSPNEISELSTPSPDQNQISSSRIDFLSNQIAPIRTQVEALDGRMWIEMQAGGVSQVSILIPIIHVEANGRGSQAAQA